MMIMVDLDDKSTELRDKFIFSLSILKDFYVFGDVDVFETRKGFHVYLKLNNEISELELILLQCLLRSDINRELFNFKRLKQTGKSGNILFKRKRNNSGYLSEEKKTKDAYEFEYLILEVIS